MNRFPKIKEPCPKKWDELTGSATTRFCDQCQHQVHNLSEHTPGEAARILHQPGRKCVAYTVQSRPRLFSRFFRPFVAFAAMLVAVMTGGCASTARKDTSACAPTIEDKAGTESDDGKTYVMVGEVEERPLWKRILHID